MDNKKLVFHSGDGFGGLPRTGYFVVKSEEGEKAFLHLSSARKYYNSLNCEKAFWFNMELIDSMVWEDEIEKMPCPKCHGSGEITYWRGNHTSIYRMGICGRCLGIGSIEKIKDVTNEPI